MSNMVISSSIVIVIVLYTCGLTFYLTWGFTLIPKFYQAIFSKTFGFKNIFLCVLCFLPFVLIDYLFPDYLEQSTIVSIYLTIGFVLWLSLASQIKYRNNMGDLLFVSRAVSKGSYLAIPLTLLSTWVIYNHLLVLFHGTESSLTKDVLGTKIDKCQFP
ncbi:MAG: hypothetical protein AAGF26_18655, partial [Cyanobacteria bacterium P01_G01_bin.49]